LGGSTGCLLMTAVAPGLWGLAVPILWVLVLNAIPAEYRLRETDQLLRTGLSVVGLESLSAIGVAFTFLATWVASRKWARAQSKTRGPAPPAATPYRLIASGLTTWAVILSALVWALLAIAMGVYDAVKFWFGDAQPSILADAESAMQGVLAVVAQATDAFIIAAGLSGLVLTFFLPAMRVGLDIALDVVNHFRKELDPGSDSPVLVRLRRGRIQARFRRVLETIELAPDLQNASVELVVIAHSQGTIAAIDALADAGNQRLLRQFSEVKLVTMGSPFTHLYQHYFPAEYPPLDPKGERWKQLTNCVKQWNNIYRTDDFVGTVIAPAGFGGKLSNNPVAPGGHTGYWSDRQVHEILDSLGLL
jgi:hypothetical protein